jgi:hypothetical protein
LGYKKDIEIMSHVPFLVSMSLTINVIVSCKSWCCESCYVPFVVSPDLQSGASRTSIFRDPVIPIGNEHLAIHKISPFDRNRSSGRTAKNSLNGKRVIVLPSRFSCSVRGEERPRISNHELSVT